MSFQVAVHRKQRLAYVRVWGALDVSSLLKLRHEILTHPDFEPGFDLLADVSALDTTALKLDDMSTIAKLQLWKPTGRRALLVRSDEQMGLAQAFAALRDPESVFIGRYLGEALDWLGVSAVGFVPAKPDTTAGPLTPSGADVIVTRRASDGVYVVACSRESPEHFGPRQWSDAILAAARRTHSDAIAWFKDDLAGDAHRQLNLVTGMLRDE